MTIYRQTANPNATNSELDAKIIIKHTPDVPLENDGEDDVVKEVEQCIIDTNGEYAECIDRLVDSMEKNS